MEVVREYAEWREGDVERLREERDALQTALAETHNERARLRKENARLRGVLRNIAEGNLGNAPWQANYERIRDVARAALTRTEGGNND